jgi:hypothetical protein
MRAAAAISSAKEYLSQERVVVLDALLNGRMPPEQRQQFIATQTGQTQALNAFSVVATTQQQELLHRLVSGPDLRPSALDEYQILSMSTDLMPTDLKPADWDKAMIPRANQMRAVEQSIDKQTVDDAQSLRDAVQRQIIIDVGLLFGMVLIAMLIAWGVARSMNRSLRELKNGALTVARYGLPQAVQRLAADRRTAAGAKPGRVRRGDRGIQRRSPRGRAHRRRAGGPAVVGRHDVRQPCASFPDPGRPAHRPPGPAGARRGGPGPSGRAVPARPPGDPDAP